MRNKSDIQYHTFLLLLIIVTAAFAWLLRPYYGALFWGAALAIIFMPVHRRILRRLGQRPNLSALASVALCILIVIIPLILITGALVQEGAVLYHQLSSGLVNPGQYFEQALRALPAWVRDELAHVGIGDMESLKVTLSSGAVRASKFLATQAFNIGQNTFEFVVGLAVMLYLLFFLLRDGQDLGRHLEQLIPLSDEHKSQLFRKFATVVRATVKGNLVVAATQGLLGGIIFWLLGIDGALLWGVLMGFLSLLPAVGAAIVWVPFAAFFLLTGAIWKGTILVLFCVLVIGLVDNLMRPLLVGKDTKMPDYVILISTLGGLTLFGLNGFVIGPLIAALFMVCWDLLPSAIKMSGDQ